ncbi:MAG: DegV family protein [Candidatus Cloacimonadales bacterium]
MTKIKYLDGKRFYNAFAAGGESIINNRAYLNKINVFPVADSDTGTNLATTIHSILNEAKPSASLPTTVRSISDSALIGARGNSGIIFAQYLVGLSLELEETSRVSIQKFALSAQQAVNHVYDSLADPVEGTILTVMREWAEALNLHSQKNSDFCTVLKAAYSSAEAALLDTPNQLSILKKSGVVDAGAQGFVNFLEGIIKFISEGNLRETSIISSLPIVESIKNEHNLADANFRYCAEAILSNSKLNLADFKQKFRDYGDSLIVAGSQRKMHVHIHTDQPDKFFYETKDFATIDQIKIDDMHQQYQVSHKRKYALGIVTDSGCDLPTEFFEKYQIQQISFGINFGDNIFLDNKTLKSEQFYQMLRTEKVHPVSSQPSPKVLQNMYDLMSDNFERTYSVHMSKELSGLYNTTEKIAQDFSNITPVNSKHLSVSQGLIVLRLARAIEAGKTAAEIDQLLPQWIEKSHILTDVQTLKYLVRGGRISPLKGFVAKVLNLKPIVTVDANGKGAAVDKSFSRRQSFSKICAKLQKIAANHEIWEYAIVHAEAPERAEMYAEKLSQLFQKKPAYIMPISPVIGVHNGIGAVGIGVMTK